MNRKKRLDCQTSQSAPPTHGFVRPQYTCPGKRCSRSDPSKPTRQPPVRQPGLRANRPDHFQPFAGRRLPGGACQTTTGRGELSESGRRPQRLARWLSSLSLVADPSRASTSAQINHPIGGLMRAGTSQRAELGKKVPRESRESAASGLLTSSATVYPGDAGSDVNVRGPLCLGLYQVRLSAWQRQLLLRQEK